MPLEIPLWKGYVGSERITEVLTAELKLPGKGPIRLGSENQRIHSN